MMLICMRVRLMCVGVCVCVGARDMINAINNYKEAISDKTKDHKEWERPFP